MMGIISLILSFFKVVLFFGNLWKEKDQLKAKEKATLASEVVNAFKETNKDRRLSALNDVVGRINRVR